MHVTYRSGDMIYCTLCKRSWGIDEDEPAACETPHASGSNSNSESEKQKRQARRRGQFRYAYRTGIRR